MEYLALGNEIGDAPEVPYHQEERPSENQAIEPVDDRTGLIAILKANKLKLHTYAKEKEKTLLRDIFSTAAGVKMLKKDVDNIAEMLEVHSLRFMGGHLSLELTEKSNLESIKMLKEIKDDKIKDKYLSTYFDKLWANFLLKQITILVTAVSQKTGLILREKDDYAKYSDGCFLKFDKGVYSLIFWW